MAAELIFYALDSDIAFRQDQTEIANNNLPECFFKQQDKLLDLQFINSQRVDANDKFNDFFTGHEFITVSGSAAADNNFNHTSNALLNGELLISVGVSTIAIDAVGSDFDSERPAGTINFSDGQSVNYNAITVAGGVFTLTTADSSFLTADFTPSATIPDDDPLITLELPIIKDPLIDVTDKNTGLYHIAFDCNNSIYQALSEGSSEIPGCIFEIQIFEAGLPILIKRFDIFLLGVLDDDGGVAPAPISDFFTKVESISTFVEQDLLSAYPLSVSALSTMLMFVRNGATSEHVTIQQLADFLSGGLAPSFVAIDFTTAQVNAVFTVPTGKRFKPETGDELTKVLTGAGSAPTGRWLADAVEISPPLDSGMTAVDDIHQVGLDPLTYYPPGTIFNYEVTIASGSGVHTGNAILKGALIDA